MRLEEGTRTVTGSVICPAVRETLAQSTSACTLAADKAWIYSRGPYSVTPFTMLDKI